MDTIVLFDPGIRSLNKGDEIIMRSAEAALSDILADNYVIKCATHAPAVTFYQNTRLNPRMKVYQNYMRFQSDVEEYVQAPSGV